MNFLSPREELQQFGFGNLDRRPLVIEVKPER
jgi:hypothetical protein